MKNEENVVIPHFRNEYTKSQYEIQKHLTTLISVLKKEPDKVSELPKLEFEEKKAFLNRYYSRISNSNDKRIFESILSVYSKSDQFDFTEQFKESSYSGVWDFEVQKSKFIGDKVKLLYDPLNVTEKSRIVW